MPDSPASTDKLIERLSLGPGSYEMGLFVSHMLVQMIGDLYQGLALTALGPLCLLSHSPSEKVALASGRGL